MSFWAVLLGFAIVARVTRFINTDSLFAPVRSWAIGRFGEHGWMPTLLYCPWCVSIWTGAPVAVAVTLHSDLTGVEAWFTGLGLWLGWSWLYAVIAQNVDPQ